MKNTIKFPTIALALVLVSFTPRQLNVTQNLAAVSTHATSGIKWKTTEIDLGEITQNKPVTIEFEFTNTGDSPVIITNVQASCGCTSTDYSKTPILSGESTKIKAVFNAAAKGIFKKQITVITNADETPTVLFFTGTVI